MLLIFLSFLQTNCTLKYLDLSWNGFGNLGALALAEALRANNTLTELDIRFSHSNFYSMQVVEGTEVGGQIMSGGGLKSF